MRRIATYAGGFAAEPEVADSVLGGKGFVFHEDVTHVARAREKCAC